MCEAQKKADRFCKHLNEGVRVKENSERLEWLQNHVNCDDLKIRFNSNTNCLGLRKLLHHGMLQKVNILLILYQCSVISSCVLF